MPKANAAPIHGSPAGVASGGFVDPLTAPERVTRGLGELRLRLLGWHRSAVNSRDPIDVAAQLFFKTIKLDGTVEL